jgi:uncharacterized protein
LAEEILTGTPTDPESPPPVAASSRWTPADRKSLIVWASLALILSGLATFGAVRLLGINLHDPTLSLRTSLSLKGIGTFFVVLATWVASRIQRRSLADYGLPAEQTFGLRFWEGAIWGFLMLSLMLLPLSVGGHFHIESVAVRGAAFWGYALGWGLAFLFVSFSEELTFRGYLLFIFARRAGFWSAAIWLSIWFAVVHLFNPGETVIGIAQVLGTGLLFCFMIRRTGNLWFALGYHASWDWAQTFFYGTADSGLKGVGHFLNTSTQGPNWLTGGSTGPEGSVFSLVVLLVAALLIHLRFPTAIYPNRPE